MVYDDNTTFIRKIKNCKKYFSNKKILKIIVKPMNFSYKDKD